jgi:hypothetical protein
MTATFNRIKKDIQELAETGGLKKRVEWLERELEKTREDLKGLKREVAGLSKQLAAFAHDGSRIKPPQLIDVLEDIAAGMKQPMKVVDLREILLRDGRFKTKAGNFYSVIVTAMNNSPKFEKIESGVYRRKDSRG